MKNPRTNTGNPDSERSLFGEILDWMLAPLLFVWPLSIAITHYFASNVASFPYDQGLREHVSTVARQIRFVGGKPVINLPGSARAFLRAGLWQPEQWAEPLRISFGKMLAPRVGGDDAMAAAIDERVAEGYEDL